MTARRGSRPGSIVHIKDLDYILREMKFEPEKYAILCRYVRECLIDLRTLVKNGIPCRFKKTDLLDATHMRPAVFARKDGHTLESFFDSSDWASLWRLCHKNKEKELMWRADIEMLFSLSDEDFTKMIELKSAKRGVFISTVHSTKGAQYKRVAYRMPENVADEPFVNYVAVTRPEDQLFVLPQHPRPKKY
jgi:hypothetical protein